MRGRDRAYMDVTGSMKGCDRRVSRDVAAIIQEDVIETARKTQRGPLRHPKQPPRGGDRVDVGDMTGVDVRDMIGSM